MGGRRVADIRWAIFRRRSSNFGASRFTVRKALKQLVQLDLWSFCTECGSTEPSSTGRRRRLPRNEQYNEIKGSRSTVEKDVPAGTMAVVRSPDFLRALRETALATLIHRRRLTPSRGEQAPTAERTVGPARMIAESLTPKPGIREQYRYSPAVV
jgi:hypothetical protein